MLLLHKHNTKSWFGTDEKSFANYFKDSFEQNIMGEIVFPASAAAIIQNDEAKYYKMTNSMANKVISAITKKESILRSVEFDLLLPSTKDFLKETVASAVQFLLQNNISYQRVIGSTLSTGGMSVTVDNTPFVFSDDIFGIEAVALLANADLNKYKIVGDEFIGSIGFSDDSTGEIEIYKWNNIEKKKNLGDFATYTVAVYVITGQQRYDYFTVEKTKELWRWSGTEWERIDTKVVDGNRYLVYKDYILAGSEGKQGVQGKQGIQGIQGFKGEGMEWLSDNYSNPNDFLLKAKNYDIVKSDIDKDGNIVQSGLILLAKVGSDLKQFWTVEAAKAYLLSQLLVVEQHIDKNTADVANALRILGIISNELNDLKNDVADNTSAINAIKSHGINVPHLEITTPLSDDEIDLKLKTLVQNVADGDVAYVGANSNWTLWKYSSQNSKWANTNNGSQHSTTTIDAYTKSQSDSRYATKTELGGKADVTSVYTKAESDAITGPMQFSIQSHNFALMNKVNKNLHNATGWTRRPVKVLKTEGQWKTINQVGHGFVGPTKVRITVGSSVFEGNLLPMPGGHGVSWYNTITNSFLSELYWTTSKTDLTKVGSIYYDASGSTNFTFNEDESSIDKFEIWEEAVYETVTVLIEDKIRLGGIA